MITFDQLLKIEAATHNSKMPQDIATFAKAKRWSKSKQDFVRYGDLPLNHVIRSLLSDKIKEAAS